MSMDSMKSKYNEESRTDHKGTVFNTIRDMCKHWGVDVDTYLARKNTLNWEKEKALTNKNSEKISDHTGCVFRNIRDMCNCWGVAEKLYRKRVEELGWSKEKALTVGVSRR